MNGGSPGRKRPLVILRRPAARCSCSRRRSASAKLGLPIPSYVLLLGRGLHIKWLAEAGRAQGTPTPELGKLAENLTVADGRRWPGRAKAELKSAAVNRSSKAGQQGKFRADHQWPVLADPASS